MSSRNKNITWQKNNKVNTTTNETQASGCLKLHFLWWSFFGLSVKNQVPVCVSSVFSKAELTLNEGVPGRWSFQKHSAQPGFTFKKNLRLFLNLSLYVGKHTSSKHRDGATETLLETDVLGGLGIAQSKCKCHWLCRETGTPHCTCGSVWLRRCIMGWGDQISW